MVFKCHLFEKINKFEKSQENWLKGDPCTNLWYGITCDSKNTTVLGMNLNPVSTVNVLRCKLPPSIGNLSNIEKIYLSSGLAPSYLHGRLPSTIARLSQLRCFYVSHSWLEGQIPAFFNKLTHLQGLFLRRNEVILKQGFFFY